MGLSRHRDLLRCPCQLPLGHPCPRHGHSHSGYCAPLITAAVALLISRTSGPAVAYVSGSLGTLIGADLLNLGKIQGLGAPIASIGGAGTFDGIFQTGIVAVLLASLSVRTSTMRRLRGRTSSG